MKKNIATLKNLRGEIKECLEESFISEDEDGFNAVMAKTFRIPREHLPLVMNVIVGVRDGSNYLSGPYGEFLKEIPEELVCEIRGIFGDHSSILPDDRTIAILKMFGRVSEEKYWKELLEYVKWMLLLQFLDEASEGREETLLILLI